MFISMIYGHFTMTSIVIVLFSDINECDSDPCENGGSCENSIGSFMCTCVAGYEGDTCESGKTPALR